MKIVNKVLLFEIATAGEVPEIQLWAASLTKGQVRFQQKAFHMGDSLEKWKHHIALLSVTGGAVVSKLYRVGDTSIKKVTENEELFWNVSAPESEEGVVVSFLRKELIRELLEQLNRDKIYVLDKWIGPTGVFNKEKYVADFYAREMNLSAIRRSPDRLNTVCQVMYHRMRLPVLLLFFFLLLGNFLVNTRLRKEYDAIQSELAMKQRTDKIQQENQKKQGRIQAEYQKIPNQSFALIADRIASYVPTNVRLHSLSIAPLNENGLVSRTKESKFRYGTILVKGQVEIPGSITLFSQFLSSDKMFSKVEILNLARQKDSSLYSFDILITL